MRKGNYDLYEIRVQGDITPTMTSVRVILYLLIRKRLLSGRITPKYIESCVQYIAALQTPESGNPRI